MYRTRETGYTIIDDGRQVVSVNTNHAPVTVTLPAKGGVLIRNTGTNALTIAAQQGNIRLPAHGRYVELKSRQGRWKLVRIRPRWRRIAWLFRRGK